MHWLLSPLAWLLLAGALALWCSCVPGVRPWLLAACGMLAAIALAAMTPMVANALVVPLERPVLVPRSCRDAPPSTALVLGGGVDRSPRDRSDFAVLDLASRRRMDRAVAWWRERDGRVLVLAGRAGRSGAPALAELMAAYAQMLGMPAAVLRLETGSDDAGANAHRSARRVPRLPSRIVLVTSAMHMRRAQAAFASAGFDVCPLAGDIRRLPSRLPWALVPRTVGLETTDAALHEWVDLAYCPPPHAPIARGRMPRWGRSWIGHSCN